MLYTIIFVLEYDKEIHDEFLKSRYERSQRQDYNASTHFEGHENPNSRSQMVKSH